MFKIIKFDKYSWANVNEVNEQNLARLKKLFKVHLLDLEDIKSDVHDPKLDIYKNYLFAVFNLPHYNKDTGRIERYDFDIFIGKNFLVTVHKGKVQEIDNLFKKLERSGNLRRDWLGAGADYLLFKVLQFLFKAKMSEPINVLSTRLAELENNIFQESDRENIKDLAVIRRNVLLFRRILEPQRLYVRSLAAAKGDFVRKEHEPYFDDVHDYLEKIWVHLEGYKDTIGGLYDTIDSLLEYRSAEIIKILTLISVALMPLTLLASVYGMNVRLPLSDKPHYIWMTFGSLAITVVLIFAILKKKKWF
jgi:magnesium transporter